MYPFEYSVAFRIRHPNKAPDEISIRLSLTPKTAWLAGDPRKTRLGVPLEGTYESTYWSCDLEHPPDVGLAGFLEESAENLAPHKEFLREIRSTGGEVEFFVGWFSNFNSGEIFSYKLLSALAELQIDLSLDVYGSSHEATEATD
jgi:hypothetical protein